MLLLQNFQSQPSQILLINLKVYRNYPHYYSKLFHYYSKCILLSWSKKGELDLDIHDISDVYVFWTTNYLFAFSSFVSSLCMLITLDFVLPESVSFLEPMQLDALFFWRWITPKRNIRNLKLIKIWSNFPA